MRVHINHAIALAAYSLPAPSVVQRQERGAPALGSLPPPHLLSA
jgi:hypothetical protein